MNLAQLDNLSQMWGYALPALAILLSLSCAVAYWLGARSSTTHAIYRGNDRRNRSTAEDIEHSVQQRTHKLIGTQMALEEAKRLAEEANRIKSNYLATMSHEIRTPLMAIAGMSYMLAECQMDEKAHNYARKIQTATNSLHAIVNDILDYSKIEAHKLVLESADFELAEVLSQAIDMVTLRAADKKVALQTQIDPALPQLLKGDALRIGQVLTNLLTNAVKFTPAGTVTLGVTLINRVDQTVELRFWVKDTGIGILSEHQKDLFQPFSQLNTSVSRVFGGTGLGLAICKSLVELMGGEISAHSTPGEGSCFAFQITLSESNEAVLVE